MTAANQQDRDQVGVLAQAVQQVTRQSVELVYADAGYTGERTAAAAKKHGIKLEVVNLSEAKQGFVLRPNRWVVERSFGWVAKISQTGTRL